MGAGPRDTSNPLYKGATGNEGTEEGGNQPALELAGLCANSAFRTGSPGLASGGRWYKATAGPKQAERGSGGGHRQGKSSRIPTETEKGI